MVLYVTNFWTIHLFPGISNNPKYYRTDIWSRTPAHKIISENHTVCSPHWIFKRWKFFSSLVTSSCYSTAFHISDEWPCFSMVCATLIWLGSIHSRLMKPLMNLPSRVYCSEAPKLFQWRNSVLWKPDFQRIPVSLLLLLTLAFMST